MPFWQPHVNFAVQRGRMRSATEGLQYHREETAGAKGERVGTTGDRGTTGGRRREGGGRRGNACGSHGERSVGGEETPAGLIGKGRWEERGTIVGALGKGCGRREVLSTLGGGSGQQENGNDGRGKWEGGGKRKNDHGAHGEKLWEERE